jgi:hypothetical protein
MIIFVNNKSVLFRLYTCTVTLTRSPRKPDRNTSTKYLRRSRRAHTFISRKYLRRSRRAQINYISCLAGPLELTFLKIILLKSFFHTIKKYFHSILKWFYNFFPLKGDSTRDFFIFVLKRVREREREREGKNDKLRMRRH